MTKEGTAGDGVASYDYGTASDGFTEELTIPNLIPVISPYTVGVDFSLDVCNMYIAIATKKLDYENPGLPEDLYNYCLALLVVHFFESSKGNLHLKSENIGGDYSYTRDGSLTSYLMSYLEIIKSYGRVEPSTGAQRTDDSIPDEFKLDQADTIHFHLDDTTVTEIDTNE